MVDIPFPAMSWPGERAQEGRGRLINVYAQPAGADQATWRRVPGLTRFATTSETGPRGALSTGSELFVAFENRMVRFDANGAATVLPGSLTGAGPVTMARNNRSPIPDKVVVSSDGVSTFSTATVTSFADPDLPQPNSVSFLDGYFIFTIGNGQIWATDLNSTAIDALSFAGAEAKPDGLTRGVVSGQLFYGFGSDSTEVWQNVGTSPFPLGRVAVIPVGLIGPSAVAGFEEGWDGTPIFVARDGTVRRMNGYQPEVVSIPDVERAILATADKATLRAYVYVVGGLAVWGLSSDDWTWEYNVSTGQWHERRSQGLERWRGSVTVQAFDRWIVGDILSGNLFEIGQTTRKEDTDALIFHVESAPVKKFPARVTVYEAYFDFVVGQGSETGSDPIETDPQVSVSWSDDGGERWSVPLLRSLGRQGGYGTLVRAHRTGRTTHHGRRWRLTVSDPVHVVLQGGAMTAA